MNNSKRIYRAAIYVRLSKEDGDLDDVRKAESNSISNQKSLILNYLKDKEDIEIVSIREDDGYSGATFDRPAFKLMLQDVKDGIIDCIVVKDLSRFAREYIDAGRYIERMFPAMGIRFIAINDAYDSADTQAQGNEIIIPFKNLINDAYCRDISIKIRSHLETKRQNGEFVGNYCVYGYKKSEIDHNVIVPDEYAGHVVQDIFCWIKNGMSLDAISDKLNVLGILSPMAYKLSNGENYKTAFQKKDELLWTPVAVRRIATNIIYTGTLVQGKITTPNHKVKTKILKPQEKWAVSHNNHEALVSLRTFQIVQRLLSVDMRMAPGKDSIYLLSGIAVCADCGALMTRKVSTVNGKKYVYYMCSNNKKNKKCSSHRIKEADLESRVFDTLRDMTAILLDADEVIKEAGNSANFRIDQKKTKERVSAKEKEITKYNQMLVSLYEDYRDGIVDKSDFAIIKESFEVKRAEAEKAIDRLQKEAENIAAGIESVLREKKTEKSHIHCAALTPEEAYVCLVDVGTDEILVYAADSLELVDTVKFPEGSGPRHIVFSSKGSYAYVITESSSEVFLMAYTPEQERKLVILGSNSTEPVGFGGAAGIRISPGERFVLASNRNADSISVFQIRENGWLRLVHNEIVPCGCPRDFQFTPDGKWVIVGLQTTDRLAVYKFNENGTMEQVSFVDEIERPTCIVF